MFFFCRKHGHQKDFYGLLLPLRLSVFLPPTPPAMASKLASTNRTEAGDDAATLRPGDPLELQGVVTWLVFPSFSCAALCVTN